VFHNADFCNLNKKIKFVDNILKSLNTDQNSYLKTYCSAEYGSFGWLLAENSLPKPFQSVLEASKQSNIHSEFIFLILYIFLELLTIEYKKPAY